MIQRYFDQDDFDRLQQDFVFLVDIIEGFKGELELSLRDGYFNLYFRGNNAAKVTFMKNNKYRISLHKKFYPRSLERDPRFSDTLVGDYRIIHATSKLLHPLLQKKYLAEIYSKIKRVNHSEELALEQMLITDNLHREDFIIIDRQVSDSSLHGRKMDLLALKQVESNRYHFYVLEVKMGNNPELKEKVATQIETYINHITTHFEDYRNCYQVQYHQKRAFGLLPTPQWESINIIPEVHGTVIVGGYSGIAKGQIEALKSSHPNLQVYTFQYKVDASKL